MWRRFGLSVKLQTAHCLLFGALGQSVLPSITLQRTWGMIRLVGISCNMGMLYNLFLFIVRPFSVVRRSGVHDGWMGLAC